VYNSRACSHIIDVFGVTAVLFVLVLGDISVLDGMEEGIGTLL